MYYSSNIFFFLHGLHFETLTQFTSKNIFYVFSSFHFKLFYHWFSFLSLIIYHIFFWKNLLSTSFLFCSGCHHHADDSVDQLTNFLYIFPLLCNVISMIFGTDRWTDRLFSCRTGISMEYFEKGKDS